MLELFSMRMSDDSVDQLTEIAENKHLPMRTMLRSWILERIDIERKIVTSAPASLQANTGAEALTHPKGDMQREE